MISPSTAVSIVQAAEQHNAMIVLNENPREKIWINPSMNLVERALDRWSSTRMRADNTSVVTLMLDPPGPPRSQVIRNAQKILSEQEPQQSLPYMEPEQSFRQNSSMLDCSVPISSLQDLWQNPNLNPTVDRQYPATGLQILTQYENQEPQERMDYKPRYTEDYLDKLQEEFYSKMLSDANTRWEEHSIDRTEEKSSQTCDSLKKVSGSNVAENTVETIQINVVSSSSDLQKKTKSKRNSGKCLKSTNLETSNVIPAGGKVTTSTKTISEFKTTEKKDTPPVNNGSRARERRCRSLDPGDVNSVGMRTRHKTLQINELQTRVLRSHAIEHTNKSSKPLGKCDVSFKRSRSVGPCDIKAEQKTRFQEREITKKPVPKTQNLSNNHERCTGSIEPSISTKGATRSGRLNQSLVGSASVNNDGENLISDSQLRTYLSVGPRVLSIVKTAQSPAKNKSKSGSPGDSFYKYVSSDNTNIKRSQSLSTKDVVKSEKRGQFHTPPPRTRSQGLVAITLDNKKPRSNLKHGVSKILTIALTDHIHVYR